MQPINSMFGLDCYLFRVRFQNGLEFRYICYKMYELSYILEKPLGHRFSLYYHADKL